MIKKCLMLLLCLIPARRRPTIEEGFGPYRVCKSEGSDAFTVLDADGCYLGDDNGVFSEAVARRITACLNACRGMPLEVLERVPHGHRHALLTTLLGQVPATELIVGATEWCRSYLRARGYSIED